MTARKAPPAPIAALTGMTVASARRKIAQHLREAGIETPELDARLLVGHALGLDQARLFGASARTLTLAETARIAGLLDRRLKHEPVARIVGEKEFWGLPLRVDGPVLVPRADTETVVEAALAVIDERYSRTAPLRIADLGVGSGALLLALLHELPNALGVGTDRDARAITLARANAAALGLGGRACFVCCDFGTALAGGFDLVVSNPPYIPTGDLAALPPDVRDFDPRLALDGGADGFDAYRALATDIARLLAPRGAVVVEVGIEQSDEVGALFDAAGLNAGSIRPDIHGIPRAVTAAVRA